MNDDIEWHVNVGDEPDRDVARCLDCEVLLMDGGYICQDCRISLDLYYRKGVL